MSTLRVNNIEDAGAGNLNVLSPMPGSVVQVISSKDNEARIYSGIANNVWHNGYEQYLTATITPRFENSGIVVTASVWFSATNGTLGNANSSFVRLMRNGVVDPDLNGNGGPYHRYQSFGHFRFEGGVQSQYQCVQGFVNGMIFPGAIDPLTFTVQYRTQSGNRFSFNRDASPNSDTSAGSHSPALCSTITLTEIAQ